MSRHNIEFELESANFESAFSGFNSPEGKTFGFGKTVGNGVEGWAPGAIFIHTDWKDAGTPLANDSIYVNEGTKTAASWKQLMDNWVITVPIDAGSVDQWVAVADNNYRLLQAFEVHTVAGTDAGSVTAQWVKSGSVVAPGSADPIHGATFNLKAAANNLQTDVTGGAGIEIAGGDKIGINFTGALTNLAGGCMVLILRRR